MVPLKVGYVGAGYMAQRVHLPNLTALEETEVVALAEVRPRLGEKVRARFRIPVLYADHRALMADPTVEAICLSGHFAGQGELARELLESGKPVFMEKPMAVSVAQAEAILAAERAHGGRLMVGYMKRYDGGNLEAKAAMDRFRASGELGAVTFVRQHGFCGDWIAGLDTPFESSDEPVPPAPRLKPAWMPDALYDKYIGYLQQYTHNVNLVRWLLDAGGRVAVRHVELDPKTGYAGVTLLEIAGVLTSLETGSLAYRGWDEHTQIYFEKGWVRTQSPPLLLRNAAASVEIYRGGARAETTAVEPAGWTWAYKEELRHFATCVRSGEPFRSPGTDALHDVRVFEEIYRHYARSAA